MPINARLSTNFLQLFMNNISWNFVHVSPPSSQWTVINHLTIASISLNYENLDSPSSASPINPMSRLSSMKASSLTLYAIHTTKKHNNHSKKAKVIISYINREAPKHSANRIKCIRWSKSKPAAAARANAIPCSFCNAVLRISSTLRSWILKSKSNKQYPYSKTKTWIDNSNH